MTGPAPLGHSHLVPLRDLSLRTKLVLALMAVGVAAVAITGVEGYRRARRALEVDALNQLTAVREERRRAVEAHFARLRLETTTLAENPPRRRGHAEIRRRVGRSRAPRGRACRRR